jgi:hypothetical protein
VVVVSSGMRGVSSSEENMNENGRIMVSCSLNLMSFGS